MPPQPLLSVRRKATAVADPKAVRRYPKLAADIAEIVALWSRIESALGDIFTLTLRTGHRVSTAMYATIRNSQIQTEVLEAAAKTNLPEADFELFSAIMLIIKRPERNATE